MSEEKEYTFEKLTPISDVNLGVYEPALDFVFANDDIRNVAITGAYGAGKSSVLAAYKGKQKDIKFVHISLAHFEPSKGEKADAPLKESVLEGKILNQLLHQIPTDRIPQTNFRVKKTVNPCEVFKYTITIVLFLLTTMHVAFFQTWKGFVETVSSSRMRIILNCTANANAALLSGAVALVLFNVFVYHVIKLQKNRSLFRKLSFQGNEVEIFADTEESFFDKYLNEVLYLFDNVEADVIVFEDMDRFDANSIFERLREINTLTNLHRANISKKSLRFFYLLRDDIFVSKDRTKFFDYIVPVVPVVDNSNSYDQLISHLEKNDLYRKLDNAFLQGLSLYVDDMRLLKNICNEFLIYYTRLNTTELDYNKMLAIIAYKNLFPKDFCDMQLGKGFVHALFDNRDMLIADAINDLNSKIEEKQSEIESVQKEHLESSQELDDVYGAMRQRANNTNDYSMGQRRRAEVENWKNNEYPKRKKAIEQKASGALETLESELGDLNRELIGVGSKPLHALITRENIDSFFQITTKNEIGEEEKYIEIKRNEYFPLLKYLIRNGYIDETYADYMTYFYENSLSRTDKIFLRSVSDKKAKEANYFIKDPALVVSRLKPTDFEEEETLNYQLIDYILSCSTTAEHLTHLIHQIKSKRNCSFVESYFDYGKEKERLVVEINKRWPTFFAEMIELGTTSFRFIRQYSVLSLYSSCAEDLLSVNAGDILTQYISDCSDYLNIESPDVEKLKSGFELLKVRFSKIDYDKSSKELLEMVFEFGYYVLNFSNIFLFLDKYLGVSDAEEVRSRSTTHILRNPESALAQRITDNMQEYLNIVLCECADFILDDEDVAIRILNDESVDIEEKKKYIARLKTEIKQLTDILDRSLWVCLVSNGIVSYSENNIVDYFLYAGLDEEIVAFINQEKRELDFSTLNDSYDEAKEKLSNAVVSCNNLTNSAYKQAVTSLNCRYDNFSIANVSDEKMDILIDCSIIKMAAPSLAFIRSHYPQVATHYITKNIDEYTNLINPSLFLQSELLSLLSSEISDEQKLKLLALSSESITVVGKGYSVATEAYILKNNLEENDLLYLYKEYDNYEPEIQNIVYDYASSRVKIIIENNDQVSATLVDRLLSNQMINKSERISLLVSCIPNDDQGAVVKRLQLLGLNEYVKVFDPQTRPKFEDSPESRIIMDTFVARGWIVSYSVENNRIKIRRNDSKKISQ